MDSDLEESERLVNLGSTTLGEPDDGSSEDGMTLQDDSPNTGSQKDDPLTVCQMRFCSPSEK